MRKNRSTARSNGRTTIRPLPARYFFAGIAGVAVLVMFPMFAVWKQAYIASVSMRQKQLTDSLTVLSQTAAQLRMTAQRMSDNERIEQLAREWLSLDHPSADHIVIVRLAAKPRQSMVAGLKFFNIVRRSLEQKQG